MTLSSRYFDGKSSRQHIVAITLVGERIRISGDGIDRTASLHELRVSEPMGDAPRLVTLPDGAFCEIHDHAGMRALLQQTGFQDHFVVRWQYSLRWIVTSVILSFGIFFAGYRWGLPWVSEKLAAEIPELALQSISKQVVTSLDRSLLAPSKLPLARQTALSTRFSALTTPAGKPVPHHVIFRANRAMRANAFALPSGTIILTDDLVNMSGNDNELMGVLAHELGHVHARHGMRLVLQGSIVGAAAAWFIGDISSIIATAPAVLLQARYSREFEREADKYAREMLEANAISPRCLADILQRMETTHRETPRADEKSTAQTYLASHPATNERLDVLQGKPCE